MYTYIFLHLSFSSFLLSYIICFSTQTNFSLILTAAFPFNNVHSLLAPPIDFIRNAFRPFLLPCSTDIFLSVLTASRAAPLRDDNPVRRGKGSGHTTSSRSTDCDGRWGRYGKMLRPPLSPSPAIAFVVVNIYACVAPHGSVLGSEDERMSPAFTLSLSFLFFRRRVN